jgi:hypothetical protein
MKNDVLHHKSPNRVLQLITPELIAIHKETWQRMQDGAEVPFYGVAHMGKKAAEMFLCDPLCWVDHMYIRYDPYNSITYYRGFILMYHADTTDDKIEVWLEDKLLSVMSINEVLENA